MLLICDLGAREWDARRELETRGFRRGALVPDFHQPVDVDGGEASWSKSAVNDDCVVCNKLTLTRFMVEIPKLHQSIATSGVEREGIV